MLSSIVKVYLFLVKNKFLYKQYYLVHFILSKHSSNLYDLEKKYIYFLLLIDMPYTNVIKYSMNSRRRCIRPDSTDGVVIKIHFFLHLILP